MFQFKDAGLGTNAPGASTAMPNSFGKVRTFKEDFENFGKSAPDQDRLPEKDILPRTIEKHPEEKTIHKTEPPQPMPDPASTPQSPQNPFQSIPTPPPLNASDPGLPAFKSTPSQTFFQEKPAPLENILPEHKDNQPVPPAPPKNKGKLGLLLGLLLAIAAAGAGFYYYWFYMRGISPATSSAPAAPAVPQSPSPAPADAQNKNIRQLVVDTSQNPLAIEDAVQKFSADFGSSASDGSLAEVKIIGKDNQPIGKKEFAAGFGIAIPDAVLMKLSEDYSLFASKENSDIRLGLVFKTVTTSGLPEEMKSWEPKMATDLRSLYLVPNAAPADASFSSSLYKNADIRYFNFLSPEDTSLDYSVISNFLIIGTSKNSTRSILDYMSAK